MAEQSDTTNPSPHKFDPLGELIALVQPLVEKHATGTDSDLKYPGPVYEDATIALTEAGIEFSVLNAYAITRMIWARYNAEEGDAHGHDALFVAGTILEKTAKKAMVRSWTDVRARILYIKDDMRMNMDEEWAELVGQIGMDIAQIRHA